MICMFVKLCYCLFAIIIFVKKCNDVGVQITNINTKKHGNQSRLSQNNVGYTKAKRHGFSILQINAYSFKAFKKLQIMLAVLPILLLSAINDCIACK